MAFPAFPKYACLVGKSGRSLLAHSPFDSHPRIGPDINQLFFKIY